MQQFERFNSDNSLFASEPFPNYSNTNRMTIGSNQNGKEAQHQIYYQE